MSRDEDRLERQAAIVAHAIEMATAPLLQRIEELERARMPAFDGRDGRDGLPGVPGPQGEKGRDGSNGRDGADGLHGKDGLGFDDLDAEHDERGRLYLVFRRGAEEKRFFVTGAFQGKFTEGESYKRGDSVIWAGSGWTALVDTDGSVKPDAPVKDGPRLWQLHVMRGKQGEKGLRGERGTDGVSGRDGRDLNQRW